MIIEVRGLACHIYTLLDNSLDHPTNSRSLSSVRAQHTVNENT